VAGHPPGSSHLAHGPCKREGRKNGAERIQEIKGKGLFGSCLEHPIDCLWPISLSPKLY
jgi:hypothetical protein